MPITKHLVSYANDVEQEHQPQAPPAKKVKKPRSPAQLANDQRMRDKHAALKASKQTTVTPKAAPKEKVVEKTVMPSEGDLERLFNSYLEKNKHRFAPQQRQSVQQPQGHVTKEKVIITDEPPAKKVEQNVMKKETKAFEKPEKNEKIKHKYEGWM